MLNQNTIILEKGNNSLNSHKLRNIRIFFRNSFITIDKKYSYPASEPLILVRNDEDLPPDKHKYRPFVTLRQPSSLPNLDFNNYSSNIPSCHQINNTVLNSIISNPSINVITVPPNFLRKKPANSYKPIIYDNIDEDLYVFKSFGKSMKRSSHFIPRPHSDLILCDKSFDEPELLRNIPIRDDVDAAIHHTIINIIQNNWDSFCERGVSRSMLDIKFFIDTGNSSPVCCRQLVYGFHESEIMTKLIADIEANKLIKTAKVLEVLCYYL